ncbi:MAG: carbon storage regulator [Sulfuricaulis sp.]|nr:carbon storage regulator [Sulfuricaulis sp.]
MLVLSRKKNEAVTIKAGGVEIRVVLVEIRGDKARLGFEAPRDAAIHRDEIWAAISEREAS